MTIDPEFKRLLPALRPEEFSLLEESILSEGCRDPIVVWENIIVDGHNRYEICQKNHLEFKTEQMSFSCREEAIRWICLNQMGRRNISTGRIYRTICCTSYIKIQRVSRRHNGSIYV